MKIKQFSKKLSDYNIDAYLVVNSTDIQYLTGFPVSDSWLLVTPKKCYFVTDGRYIAEAEKFFEQMIVVKEFKKSLAATVFAQMEKLALRRLGFDENCFTLAQFKSIKKVCPKSIKMLPRNDVVGKMREIKTEKEIKIIRKCVNLNLEVYRYLKKVIKPEMTERDIYFKAEAFVRSKEARFSFLPIIASGLNSAFPHAKLTKRPVRVKDIILIDLGIQIQGYKSDLTRIFVSDKITKPVRDVYCAVAEAQAAAINEIRPGVGVAQVDEAARKSLNKNKLAKFFTHATGHGVGLDIHEAPRLSKNSKEVLKAGMVLTVEPGVYFPGKFGIRIEDMVLVKENGCEILSRGKEVEHPFYV